MPDTNNYFKMYSNLISQQLKIYQSIQPIITASLNVNTMLEPSRLALENYFHNMQPIIQRYCDILSKLPKLNDLYYTQMQSIFSNLEHMNNSFKNTIDSPELNFTNIGNSFNEFMDSCEIDNATEDLKANVTDIKNVVENSSSLKWNEWVTLVIAILGLLISLASYTKSIDNSYQEKQLKLLEDINSSCHEISNGM